MNSGLQGRPQPHVLGLGHTDNIEPHPGASSASPDGVPGGALPTANMNGGGRGFVINGAQLVGSRGGGFGEQVRDISQA